MKPNVVFANFSSCASGRAAPVVRLALPDPDLRKQVGEADGPGARSVLRTGIMLFAGDLIAGDEEPPGGFCLSTVTLLPRSGRAVFGGAGPRGLSGGPLSPLADNNPRSPLSILSPPSRSICVSLATAVCARVSRVSPHRFSGFPPPVVPASVSWLLVLAPSAFVPPSRGVFVARGVCAARGV